MRWIASTSLIVALSHCAAVKRVRGDGLEEKSDRQRIQVVVDQVVAPSTD